MISLNLRKPIVVQQRSILAIDNSMSTVEKFERGVRGNLALAMIILIHTNKNHMYMLKLYQSNPMSAIRNIGTVHELMSNSSMNVNINSSRIRKFKKRKDMKFHMSTNRIINITLMKLNHIMINYIRPIDIRVSASRE